MKHRNSRGVALPETALTIGLSLLLVLGTAQLALIGYTQMSTDGAAFIAAHTAVVDPSASPGTVVQNIFPAITSANVQSSPASNMENVSVSRSVSGFSLVPGVATNYGVGGSDVELEPKLPANGIPSFSFAANATLYNYCYPGTSCFFPATHAMYVAQTLNPNGNGTNGQFTEWGCHQGYFDALLKAFPYSRPTSITAGSSLDMTSAGTTEYNIYSWDSGTACS